MKVTLKPVALMLPVALFCIAIAFSPNLINAQAATDSDLFAADFANPASSHGNGITEAVHSESDVQGGTYQRGENVWVRASQGGREVLRAAIVASGPNEFGYYLVYYLPYRPGDITWAVSPQLMRRR
jgi:hypothetical protein